MPRLHRENNVIPINVGKYIYYQARITILRKTYSKTFPFKSKGFQDANEYIKLLKSYQEVV